MENYFTFKDHEYKRELDPLTDYLDMQSFYLSRMANRPIEQCREYVISQVKSGGKFQLKQPSVSYLSREEGRDRKRAGTNIIEYVNFARKNNYIFVPAWNIYVPSYVKKSLYTGYILATSAVRSKYKKAMFIAEQKGDEPAIKFNDGMQSSAKISINSISGAALSANTINHTQSLHPTLTSVCAASTSLANLNNEKLIAGNRVYLNYQATLDNIITIALRADKDLIELAMHEFDIHVPNTDEVMECISKSTYHYWRDDAATLRIRKLVDTLTGAEKAAVLYIGDLYHLRKHNSKLIGNFFDGFTTRIYDSLPIERAIEVEKSVDDDVAILAKLLCKEYLMGTTMSDLKVTDPVRFGEVCANMVYIESHLSNYSLFIQAFLRPPFLNPGGNRFAVPNMIREAVLTSDTDSTIYTAQYWVKEITGSLGFEDKHYAVGFAISFLVNKTVYHQLALMSKNMGFEDEHLHTISMKNEYYFPTYVLTNQTKNYFAFISVREGNVYKSMKLEKKGVGLRSSKIPKNIMNQFDSYLKLLMNNIIEKQKITLDELFGIPYHVETEVKDSIIGGNATYFQNASVKTPDSYKLAQEAPALKLHRLWDHVFAPKYGETPPLPYSAVKISTTLSSMKRLQEWVDSIEDRALAQRLSSYIKNEGRRDLGVIYVPQLSLNNGTIPKEIIEVIDVNKQLMNVMGPFYLTLESFGYYLRNPKNTTMVHTVYKPKIPRPTSEVA